MGKITLISDPKVLEIPIKENGDSLVDIREFSELIVDHRKSPDSNSYFKLRKTLALKLIKAQKSLPNNFRFLIVEGHRPLSVQKRYFDEYSKELKDLHPDWNDEKIYTETSKFVAPPENTPPHSTGGAVDLTLVDQNNKEVDMGTILNTDPEISQNACYTSAENISDESKNNRKILIDSLLAAGFVNYPTEWWHWSYGDKYWAHQSNQPFAIFGPIE